MPKQKDSKKIEAIHAAAMELVLKTGFISLRMADVAKQAGIATGTLYVYYANKEELINSIYLDVKREFAQLFAQQFAPEQSYYEIFKALWYSYFRFCESNPEKMMFVEQFLYSGYIAEEAYLIAENFFTPLNKFLESGKKQGIIKECNTEILKSHLQGAIHDTVKMCRKQKLELNEEDLKLIFQMAWDSVKQ